MKISVEISDSELKDVCKFTGLKKKGPAIRKMVVDALMLQRRRAVAEKFISGEWKVELAGYEKARAKDRADARRQARMWR